MRSEATHTGDQLNPPAATHPPAVERSATVARMARPLATAVDVDRDERLAMMAKALGHPTRVRILRLLAERDTCVTGELASQLPFAQSTVSEHLRILREAGLIRTEDGHGRPCNCVNDDALAALKDAVASL